MKNFALGLFLGLLLGGAGAWYYLAPGPLHPRIATIQRDVEPAIQQVSEAANDTTERIKTQMEVYHLTPEEIRSDLKQTGKIVRRNVRDLGNAIKDTAADARITAMIKAKLARDPDLSVWDTSVSTTDGQVTLSGRVRSPDLVGKAMLYALQSKGVNSVISTLQVEKDQPE